MITYDRGETEDRAMEWCLSMWPNGMGSDWDANWTNLRYETGLPTTRTLRLVRSKVWRFRSMGHAVMFFMVWG
jgi:hypothetical protein